MGMDLVSLETEEENKCVMSRLKASGLHCPGVTLFLPQKWSMARRKDFKACLALAEYVRQSSLHLLGEWCRADLSNRLGCREPGTIPK
jgi:hypothetical protein